LFPVHARMSSSPRMSPVAHVVQGGSLVAGVGRCGGVRPVRRVCLGSLASGLASSDMVHVPRDPSFERSIPGVDAMDDDDSVASSALSAHAPSDLFELFNVDDDASSEDIKKKYKTLQKLVHPDVAGDEASAMAALLNEALPLLLDKSFRVAYVTARKQLRRGGYGGFDGNPKSAWAGDPRADAIFVDECSCIGCTLCATQAPATFEVEQTHGRARVTTQWADSDDDIDEAIAMCPVSCIHIVPRRELALLEFTMTSCEREDIAIIRRRLSGNMASPSAENDPFDRAAVYLKMRNRASAKRAKEGIANSLETNRELAAHAGAIASAYLALPLQVRQKGWPSAGKTGGGGGEKNSGEITLKA